MIVYCGKRIMTALLTLAVLSAAVFLLMRLAPGGPFDNERALPAEIRRNLDQKYGLDLPLPQQMGRWFAGLLRGDLHESFQYIDKPVTEIIVESLPVSATVGLWSLFFAVLIGIPLGALGAWRHGSWLDRLIVAVSVSSVSLPSFLLASLLVLVFSLRLGWLPSGLWEGPESLILPVITLASRPMAMLARLARASVLEVIHADYIRTARAKGVGEPTILLKHALRNSLIPLITLLGPLVASLITGSFVVELIFQLPGMGKYFVTSILNRDYPVAMGMTLTYGAILLACNLAVDLAYGWADPRVRVS